MVVLNVVFTQLSTIANVFLFVHLPIINAAIEESITETFVECELNTLLSTAGNILEHITN